MKSNGYYVLAALVTVGLTVVIMVARSVAFWEAVTIAVLWFGFGEFSAACRNQKLNDRDTRHEG